MSRGELGLISDGLILDENDDFSTNAIIAIQKDLLIKMKEYHTFTITSEIFFPDGQTETEKSFLTSISFWQLLAGGVTVSFFNRKSHF